LERMVFFSDAVFAIALTLLVLPLTEARLPGDDLIHGLSGLWHEMLSCGLSFLVIGTYWVAHHRTFSHVVRSDGRLLWINLIFLMCIALLPFPTAVLGEHGDTTTAVALYAAAMSVTGFASAAIWNYAAHRRRLIDPQLDARTIRILRLRGLAVPVAFIPSIAIAFASPPTAWYVWLIAYPAVFAIRRFA
jgi:uncharacterized membrane protein